MLCKQKALSSRFVFVEVGCVVLTLTLIHCQRFIEDLPQIFANCLLEKNLKFRVHLRSV